jgi:hypothetical protein
LDELFRCILLNHCHKKFNSSGDLAKAVKDMVDELNNEFGDNYEDNGKFPCNLISTKNKK